MRRMNITGLLVLLTLISFYVPNLSAQTPEELQQRETLRGLKGLHVLIAEQLRDDIKQAGLTQSILKTDVELKLRKAGIQVLTRVEAYLTQGIPYLSVNVIGLKLESPRGFIYSVRVEFRQDVILSRNRSIEASSTTWQKNTTGIHPNVRYIREVVSDLVDEFMNDYLAVNPK